MRFEIIDYYGVDDLSLDEGNYRFGKAKDQNLCISKIYNSNKSYFINLMTSIAEDDLGEPLLVYIDAEGQKIVLDGNRRLSAIKVLNCPEIAPDQSLKNKAKSLKEKTKFDFSKILAQASTSKPLIYKTVYERHAAGKGRARISWSALAAARFRFENEVDTEEQEWYSIAMIFDVEAGNPDVSDYIDSAKYSHEVFRRIFSAAVSKGIISKSIFSDKDKKIKKTANKSLLDDAREKTLKFIQFMRAGNISLSRKGDTYADSERIEKYLSGFTILSENLSGNDSKAGDNVTDGIKPTLSEDHGEPSADEAVLPGNPTDKDKQEITNENSEDIGNEDASINLYTIKTRIEESSDVVKRLNQLDSKKLSQLYYSLCKIYLSRHPSLMLVGAWSFFETLASELGKDANTSFESYLKSKVNNWFSDKRQKLSCRQSLTFIADEGNSIKHHAIFHNIDARPLAMHFDVLEKLLVKALDEAILKKNGVK